MLLDGRGAAPSAVQLSAESDRESLREFASSEYARTVAGIVGGVPPAIDLAAESRLIEALVALAAEGVLASAHDISDGGIAVALAECGFRSRTDLTAEAALAKRMNPPS